MAPRQAEVVRLLMGAAVFQVLLSLGTFAVAAPEADESRFLASVAAAQARGAMLLKSGNPRDASRFLDEAHVQFPKATRLTEMYAEALVGEERWGEAERTLATINGSTSSEADTLRGLIEGFYTKSTRSDRLAVIICQKFLEAGDFLTVMGLSDRAIARFDQNDMLYALKGEAQYKARQPDEAEVSLMAALEINPFNTVAKEYIKTIRDTRDAQTSTTFAEWVSIAKDKVGDFIVTFLALFAAFVVNSTIAPLYLKLKLRNARRDFNNDDYESFTDLIEGLLDEENFVPLRSNFRFLLTQKSYGEAEEILNKYVNDLDRLPTLLRILERENEKLAQS